MAFGPAAGQVQRVVCCPSDRLIMEAGERQHTEGCGEEASPLFRGNSPPKAGALGAEPLGKCCVPGKGHCKHMTGTQH